MTVSRPKIEGLTVVLGGSFNPRIFNPWWFAKQKLIQDEEAEKAEVGVMSSDFSLFSIGWLRVHAEAGRMQIITNQPQYYDAVRDLILGTFRILRHTPLTALGIHWMAHFESASTEEWHKVGHALAPKEIWRDVLKEPGLANMSIKENRTDRDWTNVTVEPSMKVQPGIYFEVHDHFDIAGGEAPLGAEIIIKALEDRWAPSFERAPKIMRHVLEKTIP